MSILDVRPADELKALLEYATPDERAVIAAAIQAELADWRQWARPEQIWPADDPRSTMYLRGGRGSGKTWSGGHNLADLIKASEPGEWGVVGPTFGDARDTCIESSESGLIVALGGRVGAGGVLIETGPHIARWNRSMGEIWLRNGGIVYADGADDGALRIQGKNLRGLWADEVGLWRRWQTAWDESIRYAVRLAPARIIATGTPKRNMPARQLVKRLIEDPDVIDRRLRTRDNAANLHPAALAELLKMEGTNLGRQELEGDLIDDLTGALWTVDMVTEAQVPWIDWAGLRVVTAIDPAVTSGEDSDETGMIVAGATLNGTCPICGPTEARHAFVLADRSGRYSPGQMATTAVGCHDEFAGDRIIAEVNNGGDYIERSLRAVDQGIPYRAVHATRGKLIRAEPVAALYEQGRVHHCGGFPTLEDQLTSWVPGDPSPDRLDALVWALTDLLLGDPEPERGGIVW